MTRTITIVAAILLTLSSWTERAVAATTYTDETAFLAALSAASYSTVSEGFEDDAVWGSARSTIGGINTLPSVFNLGITWAPNTPSVGITTSNGSAHSGSWGFFEYPHGDFVPLPATSITDGFLASTSAPATAFGGWFSGQGTSPSIEILLDGTPVGDTNLGSVPVFLGVIEPAGFQSVELSEQDGTYEDQAFVFGDDFTFGVPTSSLGTCGDGNTDFGEQCDDSNTTDGDCCSASCLFETGSCDDGDPLTSNDQCSAGVCSGADLCSGVTCSASDQCHDVGTCDPATGLCSDPPSTTGTSCDDSNACTSGETCDGAGSCSGGSAVNCDDSNACTTDTCIAPTGCAFVNNSNPCDDSDACTDGDTCSAGVCTGGPPLNCDDGDVCTTDSCDGLGGCANTNNTDPCDDGDLCTDGETCDGAGSCSGGSAVNCDDSNACTTDSCDSLSGCANTDNTDPCDDGDLCTWPDACSSGSCGGTPYSCDDGDVCTTDSCDGLGGCANTNNTDPCDDGDVCTWPDACSSGSCAGTPYSCDDSNLCTADACNGDGTCINDPIGSACADSDPCSVDSCDPLLGCSNLMEPAVDCRQGSRTSLVVKNNTGADKDQLKWSFKKGDAVSELELGDPTASTSYTLCVYDHAAGEPLLATRIDAPPGGAWDNKGNGRLKYKDKDGLADGTYKAILRSGDPGKSKAQLKAKGANLPTPTPVSPAAMFDQDPDLTVQLHNSEGVCWTSSFQPADTSKSDENIFKAKTR